MRFSQTLIFSRASPLAARRPRPFAGAARTYDGARVSIRWQEADHRYALCRRLMRGTDAISASSTGLDGLASRALMALAILRH